MSKVELYLGDCLEILPTLANVDAVITDPPYGIGWKPRVNHQDQTWVDDVPFDPAPFLKVGKWHLFWGANYFADKLPISASWLAWIKRPIAQGVDFSRDQRSYATMELAWSDYGKNRYMVHVWDGGKRAGIKDNRTFCHPSQKPVELMIWCIATLPEDCTILDPFMGSGTMGVACIQTRRNFIGIEIDPTYFAIAEKRISDAQLQLSLF